MQQYIVLYYGLASTWPRSGSKSRNRTILQVIPSSHLQEPAVHTFAKKFPIWGISYFGWINC
jgi:hypothetical protein